MTARAVTALRRIEQHEIESDARALLGFWLYLMTDIVLFAGLFATYAVLRPNTSGGPDGAALFNLPLALTETVTLLVSSFTCGLGVLSLRSNAGTPARRWFALTFLLGIAFLSIEITDFRHLVSQGDSWTRSGFLSAYFTLVGTHGVHIVVGLVWMAILVARTRIEGLTRGNVRRLVLLSIFWHFLDVIWIFIFTIVYLVGTTQQ